MSDMLSFNEDVPALARAPARLNMKLVFLLASVLSSCASAVVSATWAVARFEARVSNAEHNDADMNTRVTGLETDRHERDERRIKLAADLGVVNQRLITLEQTAKTVQPLASTVNDMDQRGTLGLGQMRHEIDGELAALSQRTAVLESQMHWLGDHLPADRKR